MNLTEIAAAMRRYWPYVWRCFAAAALVVAEAAAILIIGVARSFARWLYHLIPTLWLSWIPSLYHRQLQRKRADTVQPFERKSVPEATNGGYIENYTLPSILRLAGLGLTTNYNRVWALNLGWLPDCPALPYAGVYDVGAPCSITVLGRDYQGYARRKIDPAALTDLMLELNARLPRSGTGESAYYLPMNSHHVAGALRQFNDAGLMPGPGDILVAYVEPVLVRTAHPVNPPYDADCYQPLDSTV